MWAAGIDFPRASLHSEKTPLTHPQVLSCEKHQYKVYIYLKLSQTCYLPVSE